MEHCAGYRLSIPILFEFILTEAWLALLAVSMSSTYQLRG